MSGGSRQTVHAAASVIQQHRSRTDRLLRVPIHRRSGEGRTRRAVEGFAHHRRQRTVIPIQLRCGRGADPAAGRMTGSIHAERRPRDVVQLLVVGPVTAVHFGAPVLLHPVGDNHAYVFSAINTAVDEHPTVLTRLRVNGRFRGRVLDAELHIPRAVCDGIPGVKRAPVQG